MPDCLSCVEEMQLAKPPTTGSTSSLRYLTLGPPPKICLLSSHRRGGSAPSLVAQSVTARSTRIRTVPYQSADGTPGEIEIIRPAKTHINDKGRSSPTINPEDSACCVEYLNLQHENICQGH
jgi:hypothetical protein